jgi:DNA-binding winged helix-turn-helix (wHTH) protein
VAAPVRYRFGSFIVSPRQRALWCEGREVPLIPRYFDLLVLLIERRAVAVHRNEIFERVWSDVVVSDGALSQAVRTLRRALGDDSREPTFIRTISRHGYRFVFPEVVEEPETAAAPELPPATTADPPPDSVDVLVGELTAPESSGLSPEERRDAAVRLHAAGAAEALARVQPSGQADAWALLRDTRWDVPGAADVPLFGRPGGLRAAAALMALRLREAWRLAARRWVAALCGGCCAGAVAGTCGGLLLWAVPVGGAPAAGAAVLALIGAVAGGAGAAGVGGGLALAEALSRSWRWAALLAGGAAGGLLVGATVQVLTAWTLDLLFGLPTASVGGAIEGLSIGAAAGGGYAAATRGLHGGGMAAPRGRARLRAATLVALYCAAAALVLNVSGRPMVGGLVNEIAQSSRNSRIALVPLARFLGEPDLGRFTGSLIAATEGAFFGFGLTMGLTHRPARRE